MEDPIPQLTTPSRLQDVAPLTEIFASSSKQPTEVLNKPTSQAYISHLTTLPLSVLLSEPSTLQTQAHHLTSSLTSLTHTSYPTFISLHETTSALTDSLSSLTGSLDSLLNSSLPALEECAANWKDRTDAVLRERSKARVVLEQHEKIRDLLDIPVLIDTCVRNGYFAEALSLVSHATALASSASSGGSPPLILSSVLAEVHNSVSQMLLSLLATLYEPNRKLPALWKAVNFLRKMDAFGPSSPFASPPSEHSQSTYTPPTSNDLSPEEQLALAFLLGRESCLRSSLEPCARDVSRITSDGEVDNREKEDLARYLKKYIDVWREGVYDIITQYSTIFLERSSVESHGPGKTNGTGPHSPRSPRIPTTPRPQEPDSISIQNIHTLLATYASRALTSYLLPMLSSALPLLSLSLLPSLLTQLTYCSTAFARLGLDFRGLLGGEFGRAVQRVVNRDFQSAGTRWMERLNKASSPSSSNSRTNGRSGYDPPSRWLISPSFTSSPPVTPRTASTPSSSPAHIPPQLLASYPPLAEHTNALLGVLNGLRLLAPPTILPTLLLSLEDILSEGGDALLAYIQAVFAHVGGSDDEREKERKVARAAGDVYFGVFVLFARRALVEGVYSISIENVPRTKKGEDGGNGLEKTIKAWEAWVREIDGVEEEEESEEEEDERGEEEEEYEEKES
ncbi:Dor1-like family-domain-containing protein [Crucibulum laeve]|uniref:Conserved oligomeric Golgi complex subunit 8 n=1 Tax=Crucibulum laeve TaxID=68775 RepID=A0A5C3MAZ1_9AGAR|nr:Dor1-like family-domain-containing protein [Crucibulum laeve]